MVVMEHCFLLQELWLMMLMLLLMMELSFLLQEPWLMMLMLLMMELSFLPQEPWLMMMMLMVMELSFLPQEPWLMMMMLMMMELSFLPQEPWFWLAAEQGSSCSWDTKLGLSCARRDLSELPTLEEGLLPSAEASGAAAPASPLVQLELRSKQKALWCAKSCEKPLLCSFICCSPEMGCRLYVCSEFPDMGGESVLDFMSGGEE
ncbi:hypothetical protein DV515_00018302 [Chloebia gouldiae]|uniref:Uncharacterized protein n=1 Tax=Chloebia gouldiae TaxID=44316 RepID=A0A3L8Q845_CHLGU|nr:hypothetical protein DV515_00018302 [Chloebia gouldiae]